MLVANARGCVCFPRARPVWWLRRLDAQGAGCPQQSGQQQQQRQQRGGGCAGRALAERSAAAARLLAPQLAQDARVRGWAQAAHVVVARPSVLAVQELAVADIRCRTGRGRGEEKQNQFKFIWYIMFSALKKISISICAPPPPQTKHVTPISKQM